MEVENLENYFLNEILRRGFDYYKKGKVKEIIKLKGGYLAIVSGTTNYRVMISEHNGTLKMSCTCPYAADNNCKHMAAVLYCFKSGNIPIKKSETKNVVVTDFDIFKKEFRKEYNKLFNHRSYLHENELKEYGDLINQFASSAKKYIKSNKNLAYKIFEYLLIEVDKIDVYDMHGEKENIYLKIYLKISKSY